MNNDIDSPEYNDTNIGDPRETPEEKEIARLEAKNQKLMKALGNCYMMARRRAKVATQFERTQYEHIIRFCEETGLKAEILRAQVPIEITGG